MQKYAQTIDTKEKDKRFQEVINALMTHSGSEGSLTGRKDKKNLKTAEKLIHLKETKMTKNNSKQ